jgi:hypothetical protein
MANKIDTCNFNCLTECPSPKICLYNDPDMGKNYEVKYPKFFWWRFNNLPDNKKPQELTPDSMDSFYPELKNKTTYRCPRCLSVNIYIGEKWIICRNCDYNEPLIDFPENLRVRR